MPRAYIRLDPNFFERKAVEQEYPVGAVATLVGVLCLAESQPTRGSFRDRRLLGALLGPYRRWIPYLIEHGDLVEQASYPRLQVDGWKEWQEGDVTVPERMARLRSRRRRVTVGVTPGVTAADTQVDVTPRLAEAEAEAQDNSGERPAVTNGAPTFMGYRPKKPVGDRLPGDPPTVRHNGQHKNCAVCAPLQAAEGG